MEVCLRVESGGETAAPAAEPVAVLMALVMAGPRAEPFSVAKAELMAEAETVRVPTSPLATTKAAT